MSNKLKIICASAGSALLIGLIAVVVVLSVQNHKLKIEMLQEKEVVSTVATVQNTAFSGTIGSNLTWTLDPETFTLTIDGEGDMEDKFDDETRPSYFISYSEKVRKVVIGDRVTSIAPYAFEDFSSLTSVKFGESVQSIGHHAFYNSGVESVALNNALESIGNQAFDECWNLTDFHLPQNYRADEDVDITDVFSNSHRAKITVDENNPYYSAIDGNLYNKVGNTLVYCSVGGDWSYDDGDSSSRWPDWEIPNTVTNLGQCCMSGNCIKTLTVPNSIKALSQEGVFFNLHVGQLKISDGITEVASLWADSIEELILPDSVKKFDTDNLEAIEKITFSKESAVFVTGKDGFIYTKSMKTLVLIPEEVVENGINKKTSTYSFEIPDTVKYIAPRATRYLGYAYDVDFSIPESVTSIGDYNFNGIRMKDERTLKLPKNLKTIGFYCFQNCTLHSITLPESVQEIGNAFLEDTDNGRYDEKTDEYIEKHTKLMVESENAWISLDYDEYLPDTVDVVFS